MLVPNIMDNIFIWEDTSGIPYEEMDYETVLTSNSSSNEITLSLYHLSPYFLSYIGVYLNGDESARIKKWADESSETLYNGSRGYGLWIKVGESDWERFSSSNGTISNQITVFDDNSVGLQANSRIQIKLQLRVPRVISCSMLPKLRLNLTYLAIVSN